MNFEETYIKGTFIVTPQVFGDGRGYFCETFRKDEFESHVGHVEFIQDNESRSSRGVLRGLHFQKGEYAQAKLVRVIRGSVLDVAVDIRRDSPTFGKHFAVELSEENKRQLFIPRGMAHGFAVLRDDTVFAYKVDNVYSPANESGIRYDDPDLAVDWLLSPAELILSEKDKRLKYLGDIF